MIVADTGAILALVDADDKHHLRLRQIFEAEPSSWLLPWAILPEVDYLLGARVGLAAQEAFLSDVADEAYAVEWGVPEDMSRAWEICTKYCALRLGLVDAVVMAVAERVRAEAIATLDLRHFGVVRLRTRPRLLPRDA